VAAISGSRRPLRPVALIAYVFAVTMLGTTLPTPLYPSYERMFGFGQLAETVVFATYALGVLATLLLLGETSDRIGRRPVLLLALAAGALSAVVFVIADAVHHTGGGLALLLLGRLLSGVSGGLMTGTATAALTDAVPTGRARLASLVAAMSQVTGLGLGPLVGGVLVGSLPRPLVAIWLLYLGVLGVAAVAVVVLPETVDRTRAAPGPLVSPLPLKAIAAQIKAPGLVGFAGFAVLGLFTGVCASFLALSGQTDPVVTGVVVFSVFAASALGQLAGLRLPGRAALLIGTAALAAGIALVGLSLRVMSVPLLEIGGLIAGAGQGMSFRAALGTVTAASTPSQRGEAASSFFAICYVGISLPIVGLGIATRAFGLPAAGQALALLIAALAVTTLLRIALRPEPA
jgi:predicted MFS family arabinose efflux permease